MWAFLMLSFLLVLFRMIDGTPWWSFVIPVALLGAGLPAGKFRIAYFLTGFTAGFFVWVVSTVYYNSIYNGVLIYRIGIGYGLIALVTSGLIGGLLTGLAFHTGKSLTIKRKKSPNL